MKFKISRSQWEEMGKKAGWIKKAISTEEVSAIKELRDKSTVSLNDAKKFLDVIGDCINLSSGTMATLTGIKNYADLDIIQQDFVNFTKTMIPKRHYSNWQEAWDDFGYLKNS